jgi:hypothetical protein
MRYRFAMSHEKSGYSLFTEGRHFAPNHCLVLLIPVFVITLNF